MFQFPPFAPMNLFIQFMVILADWVPPFGHYRVKAFLAARRYFSQPDTSFVASRYLGILRTPLIASTKASLPLFSLSSLEINRLNSHSFSLVMDSSNKFQIILNLFPDFSLFFLLLTSYSLFK